MFTLFFIKLQDRLPISTEQLIELSAVYDNLYKRAVELNKKYKPCGFGWCDKICHGQGKCMSKIAGPKATCCSGCKYLGPNGCKVESLTCKLWFCDYIEISPNRILEFQIKLKELKSLAQSYGLYTQRGSKADHLKDAVDRRKFIK